MGLDDDNVGDAPTECPGHEFLFLEAVPTEPTEFGLVGLNSVDECTFCGALRYRPSRLEGGK